MQDSVDSKEPLSRREREHEAHRQEILKVAEAVFSVNGFDGTTIEMVAKQADFSVGSIYNFFKGKEDLFRQVFLQVAEQRIAGINNATASLLDRPWDALRALIDVGIKYYVGHGEFLRTAFSAVTSGGSRALKNAAPPPEFLRAFRGYFLALQTVIAAVLKAPEARPFSVNDGILIFEGVCREYLLAHARNHETGLPQPLPADAAEEMYEFLCRIYRK